jgi:hypothetical protein
MTDPGEYEKVRQHRFTLRDLLTFDLKHDGFLLILTFAPFAVLCFFARRDNSTEAIYKANGALHNWVMYQVLFCGSSIDPVQFSDRQGYAMSNVFPLYPVLLWIALRLSFGNVETGIRILAILLSGIANLVFYRLCRTLRFVSQPFLTACLFTIYPMRSVFLRHIASEYTLVLILICGIFIGKRVHHNRVFSLSIFLLILTSELGIWICLGLFVHPLFSRNRIELRNIFLPFIPAILLLSGFHAIYADSSLAYFHSILRKKQFPFKEMFIKGTTIDFLRGFHGLHGYYIISMIACSMLIAIDKSIGIPITLGLLCATARSGACTFDIGAPIEAFSALLAFDGLIKSTKFQMSLPVLAPLYAVTVIYLTTLLMNNRAQYGQIARDI